MSEREKIKVTLDRPIDGQTEITITEPTVGDLLDAEQVVGGIDGAALDAALMERMTGLSRTALLAAPLAVFRSLITSARRAGFFGGGRHTSGDTSPS